MKFLKLQLLFIGLFHFMNIIAQDSTTVSKKVSIKALPVVYYLPETSLAFGFAGVSTFKTKPTQSRFSLVQMAGIYTLRKQFLFTTLFDLFLKDEKYRFIGDVYISRYYYNFYGIGRPSLKDDFERYLAFYPSTKLAFYRKISSKSKLGLLHQYQGIGKIDYIEGGTIDRLDPIGKNGGTISNLGMGFLYEGRDNLMSPTRGNFFEAQFYKAAPFIGSDFNYYKFNLDVRKYISLGKNITLANQLFLSEITGDAPFYDYNQIGSTFKMRGMSERRYRDKALLAYQSELRLPIYKRFRINLFGSFGHVGSTIRDIPLNNLEYAYGIGLRYVLNKVDKTMIRVDIGRSREGTNFYFTTSEAF
jgi:outer membrane protein assembly factor BamA